MGESKEFSAEVLRKHLTGGHVSEYMQQLLDDDEDAYKRQFGRFVKLGITPGEVEGIYLSAHRKIRADPSPLPKGQDSHEKEVECQETHLRRTQGGRCVQEGRMAG